MKKLSPQARSLIKAALNDDKLTEIRKEKIRRSVHASLGNLPLPIPGAASAKLTKLVLVAALAVGGGSSALLVHHGLTEMSDRAASQRAEEHHVGPEFPSELIRDDDGLNVTPTKLSRTALSEVAGSEKNDSRETLKKSSRPGVYRRTKLTTKPPPRSSESLSSDQSELEVIGQTEKALIDEQIPEPPESVAESLREESALLKRAQQALNQRDPHGALKVLALHHQRYPKGVLRHERAGARLIALCHLRGHEAMRDQAQRYVKRRPNIPISRRVRFECKLFSSSSSDFVMDPATTEPQTP